jgi:hypothetical protein
MALSVTHLGKNTNRDHHLGLNSLDVVNEMGREFGTYIVDSPAHGSGAGRFWNVRCKVCGALTTMRGVQIRRDIAKRGAKPCKSCLGEPTMSTMVENST